MAAPKRARVGCGSTHINERGVTRRVAGVRFAMTEYQVMRGARILTRHASLERARAVSDLLDASPLECRVSETEREAGKRARFHVYYELDGKKRFDPSWAATADDAERQTRIVIAELFGKRRAEAAKMLFTVALAPAALATRSDPCPTA